MKVTKKHMQSIITDQQLAFEKFQKSFPKQVTDLIHLKLDPKLHADVIKFMLVIIKDQSQLKKTTEDYLSKQSDSLIIKIYTDCSNLELQAVNQAKGEMEIETDNTKMIVEKEDIRQRTNHPFKIVSKGQTLQETTLLESKFIDYALTFVNTILKYPDTQGQSFQEVTPFSMNFVQIPFQGEYLTYNLKQIRKAIHSLSLMIQIEDIQREYKILYKILDKIEYYLDQKPRFQWIDGKWSPISQKQYDIFLGQLLRIINQIFETSNKRSRRITPQLAKQLTECPKFFIILGGCIDRIIKGYDESESYNSIPPNPTIVHEDSEKILLIETVHLLSNINKENPNLIEKLLEEKIIQKTITALQVLSLPHDTKSISQIIYFLYHISLKEQGRSEIMKSKLLQKIFDVFIDDDYSEEFYAYTLSSVIEAIQNYYNNIKEVVEIIYEKLNDLLISLRKKCVTYTDQIERYLKFGSDADQSAISQEEINFNYKSVLCYQIFNVCKLIEKLITGIENVYPDTKNKYAGECLLNYLDILQFPFLFLMPQRTTHKTPFFSVKTTCKAIYSKLDTKSEVENNKINKVLDINIQKIEELVGKKIEDVSSLNLELVNDLTAKNFLKLIRDNKDVEYYKQIKLYQQLQFLDAMINTFRSLRITSLMSNYYGFVKKISCLFPITFNQRFYEQFSFVKQKIVYLEESALTLRKQHEQDNESLKHEENNLENELKEFKLYFKENILSFKNHVNHYSYQNIIFYTILKLVYQNYSMNEDQDGNSPNKQDVLRLISLTISNIDISSVDIKVLEKYDMKTLEVFSSLAGSLVMLTQILQIFMKESRLINYMILNSLQKDGSIGKVVELAKKFSEIWQQSELKSLQKNQKDTEELSNLSKDSQAYYRKYQTLLTNSIDHCLETINYKLEYFFKMISLQIQFNLNFKKEQKEEYREDVKQGIYGWHYEQIKSQQMILKQMKVPSKNKYYSMLIEFLITHIELQLLPRYQNTKKFTESEKNEKSENANLLTDDQFNMLNTMFPKQTKEFFQYAVKEFKREKQQFSTNLDINAFTEYILDKQEILSKQFTEQPDPTATAAAAALENKNEAGSSFDTDSIAHVSKMKKDDFYAKVKSDAEEMCQYLLRELFCFKNHSDQILALLMRKELADIEFVKTTITKIKEIQVSEKKKQSAMEIEETKTTEEPQRRSRRGQSAGHTSSRFADNSAGTSSIQIQQGGDIPNPLQSTIHLPLFMRNSESRNQSANPAAGSAGSSRQDQLSLFQPPANIFNNPQGQQNAPNSGNLVGQQENQRLRNLFLDSQFNDSLNRYRASQSNRYQIGSRGRHGMVDANQSNSQQFMGQKQDKDQQKIEQLIQFKQQISQWSDDHLITTFQDIQESHTRISYVIFSAINLLVTKIFKDFKFKNPFKGSKETNLKLHNNELLHVPSKLDSSCTYKLELINAIIPFAEKFGMYGYKELTNDKINAETEQTDNANKTSTTAKTTDSKTNTTNQMQLGSNQSQASNPAEESNQNQQKLFTLKLLSQEDLELKWKEGNESYQIGVEFIKMAKHLFKNGYSLFNIPKKGEDKELHKQSSFDAISNFIKNQCHLIQKINSMNLKFKQNLKKDIEKATQEEIQLQNQKKAPQVPSSDKNSKEKSAPILSSSIASAANKDNSNKMIPEESTVPAPANLTQQDSKKKKNKNKKKKKSKKSKKQQPQSNKNQGESNQDKQKVAQKGTSGKQSKANANSSEEKKIQEKIKQLKDSQNQMDSYEKEVVSMFVSLLHFNNEQHDYYGQSLITVPILTFILDTIKSYSESNKQYLNQFITEKGIFELLKIRVQTDQIDLIIEKLNVFLTNITQDPVMAMANYESKIKYFFYEKCIHQQTLMYQINLPYSTKKSKRSKKDTQKKVVIEESLGKKQSSQKNKVNNEESVFTAAASTEWNNTSTNNNFTENKQSPFKYSSSQNRRSVSPQKLPKSSQTNTIAQSLQQSLQQIVSQDQQINSIPTQIPEKKQKKMKVSQEEFQQRFNSFKNIPLFQEVLSKLCEVKKLFVKQKASKSSASGVSKSKQPKPSRSYSRSSRLQFFGNFFDIRNNDQENSQRSQSNRAASSALDAPAATGPSTASNNQEQSLNQEVQRSASQQQAQNSVDNAASSQNANNSQAPVAKDKKSSKNKVSSSKKKGKTTKGKKKVMVQKEYYILRDDIQLHKLQFIPKENFLQNLSNSTQIPVVPVVNNQTNKQQDNKDSFKRSASASKHSKKQNINLLFKQKSEGKQSSVKSDQNLTEDVLSSNKGTNANSPSPQNNYNQMINFVAPTYIYETINQILESIVIQFTKKILQNYDILHKKQKSNSSSAEQNDDYLFNNIILLKAIQIIARQQAILVPQIVRFRCSRIVKKIVSGHPLEQVFNKQLGTHFHFLKFITKCANYFSISQVKGLIFELCLDKQILYEHSSHNPHANYKNNSQQQQIGNQLINKIIPFGAEIRKKVLGEIYSSIENEMLNDQNILEKPHTIHILISNILLHLNLLNIREVAKLSLRNFTSDLTQLIETSSQLLSNTGSGIGSQDPLKGDKEENYQSDSNGYNFAKLYGDILKKFDISKMSQMQNVIVFVTSILEMLYILNYYFILYPSGISGGKHENKKKDGDYMSKFIQSQILTQKFQNHIKQYAVNHQGSFGNILSGYPQDQFGGQRRQFNFPFNRDSGLNQLGLFNRNVINFDPLNALSRFTQNAPNAFNFLNPIVGGNVSIRMNTDRDPSLLQDTFLSNHLRRNTAANNFISLATQARRQANNDVDRLFRGMGENSDGNPLNEGNRDEEAENLIMGRMNEGDDDEDEDDEEDEEEEEEEEEEDEEEHMNNQFEESLDDDDEDDEDGDDDEEDEEEEEESEVEEEEEEDDDIELDEEEVEEEEDEGEDDDEDLEDEEDGNNLLQFNNMILGIDRRMRRNQDNRENSSQRSDFQGGLNRNSRRRSNNRSSRNRAGGLNRDEENEEPGSQQSMGNQQEDFIAEEDDISGEEDEISNIDEDEEGGLNLEHAVEEEDDDEDGDEEVAIYLDFPPGVQNPLIGQNEIQIIQQGEGDDENQGDYHGEENDGEQQDVEEVEIDDDEDEENNRDGSYYNEDWEEYSSGDEISEVGAGDAMSNEDYYEENSAEQEVDVRDREDDDDDDEEEGDGDEEEADNEHHQDDEDEDQEQEGEMMSEEESNVWNDHEFSEEGSNAGDEENSEDQNDDEVDEIFDNHPHVIDINNLVNQVDGDDDEDEDIEDDENDEDDDERRSNQMYDENLEQNGEDENQANNGENGERDLENEMEEMEDINHLEEEDDEEDDDDDINELMETNFGFNRNGRQSTKEASLTKFKEKINEDPDCKKQQNAREITEFTNIVMSECLKDSYRRCQQLIQVHYIGTTQQNIAYHTCLKEVQREVALIEKQASTVEENGDEQEQQVANSSPKKVASGDVILHAEMINKIFDKSVYVALLIYYKHSNFESTYNKFNRNNYAQHNFMENQGGSANISSQPQQELSNTQMVSSPYMANDRRSQAANNHPNGDLSRATQYRLGVRMPHHMQMNSYNRHIHNRHQNQNRQVESQESDIPGSSLNELIQQVATANVQRTTSSNSTFNNLNQLIRGSISNLGSTLGLSNFNQLIRQNALFNNPHQIYNSSSFGGRAVPIGRFSQNNNNNPSIGSIPPSVLLDGGQMDLGSLNFQIRNPLGQIGVSQQSSLPPIQSMDILLNATSNSIVNNNNNANESEISLSQAMQIEPQQSTQSQQSQIPQIQEQRGASQQVISLSQELNRLEQMSSANQEQNSIIPRSNSDNASNSQLNPQANAPSQNANNTSNQEEINQIVNEFTSIAPLLQASLNPQRTQQQPQSSRPQSEQASQRVENSQQNQQPSSLNQNPAQSSTTSTNNDYISQLVSGFNSIAPLLIASFDRQGSNTNNNSSNNQSSEQPAQAQSNPSSSVQANRTSRNEMESIQRESSSEQTRPTQAINQPSPNTPAVDTNTQPQQVQQPRSNVSVPIQPNLSQNSIMVLSRLNLDASFLTRHGLDFQIFDELPDDIKEEMIFSYIQFSDMETDTNQNQNNQPANNQAAPANVAQVETSENSNTNNNAQQQNSQSTQQQPALNNNNEVNNNQQPAPAAVNPVTAPQINQANVDFVNQSDINLRVDILLQSEDDFLRTLTPEMQEEARRLRESQGVQVGRNNYMDFRDAARQRPSNQSPIQNQQLMNQMVNDMFKSDNLKNHKKQLRLIDDWINKDQFIYKKLIETDDKFIESVLRLIYYGGKQPNIFPLQLLELICKNPSVEQKVFDSLMFILMNPNMEDIKQAYQKEKNQSTMVDEKKQDEEDVFGFPLLNTYHRNSKETDYKKVYLDVSLKILRIIQKLTMKRALFFIDTEQLDKTNFMNMQQLIQIEKEKGNLGCIRELKKFAAEINSSLYAQKSFSLPYFQFIYLLTQEPFRSNYDHLNYLLNSIQNITKKLFQYHSGKQEIEEETMSSINAQLGIQPSNSRGLGAYSSANNKSKDLMEGEFFDGVSKHSIFAKDNSFQLHPDVIRWICSIFSSECLNEILIKKLSLIINQLCYDKNNLEMFIAELRNIIKLFSIQINKQVVKCLQSIKNLDRNSPSFSSQFKIHLSQIEFQISGEKKIQKIFQIIYELFEKSFYQLEEESKLKENAQKSSVSKNDLNQQNENEMEEEEEEKKQDNNAPIHTNANVYGGNRRTSISDNPQHRNRVTSTISNVGDQNKSSAKKQNTKQNIKEQERLENIKKEIRSKFSEIISHQNFNELWINCAELFSILGKYEPHNLSSYNTAIEKLQPIMESYFIIFRIMHDEDFEFIKKSQPLKKSQQQKQIASLADDEILANAEEFSSLDFDTLKENIKDLDIQNIFRFICEQCKVVINQMIRQNLKQKKSQNNRKMNDVLQKDPFEIIFKRHPSLIDFENKKNYFKYEMMNLKASIASTSQRRRRIKVRRKHIFEDSFQQIDSMKPEELKQKFIIEFDQEEGIDAGGLIREWFILLSKAIFNPDYLLFKPSSTGNTYQPNKSSYLNEPHLQYFKFVGRVVGKALFEGQLLDAYFTRSFYKHILGQALTYHDIEDQDYQFYKGLKWIMENDISIMDDEMTFSYEENEFDNKQIVELKPNGQHLKVTEENKQEYVKLICYARMAKNIKAQIEHFLEGFHELIPFELVKIFDSHELELMISGLPDIDIQDLRENTEYQNYTPNSKIIEWFWEIMEEFDNTMRASFLQFVTGTSKVPVEGFKGLRGISGLQKFQIHKAYDPKKLPIAHTCFNQLDIPDYPTKEILKKKLLLAISEGKEGFGFA